MRFPAPNAPPTNLVVFNETITSLNTRWTPPPGRVQNYRITYVPTAGGRTQSVSHRPTHQTHNASRIHTALCSHLISIELSVNHKSLYCFLYSHDQKSSWFCSYPWLLELYRWHWPFLLLEKIKLKLLLWYYIILVYTESNRLICFFGCGSFNLNKPSPCFSQYFLTLQPGHAFVAAWLNVHKSFWNDFWKCGCNLLSKISHRLHKQNLQLSVKLARW